MFADVLCEVHFPSKVSPSLSSVIHASIPRRGQQANVVKRMTAVSGAVKFLDGAFGGYWP